MPYRYKKKYRVKPVPIMVLILIILMIVFAFIFVKKLNDGYFSAFFGGEINSAPSSQVDNTSADNNSSNSSDNKTTSGTDENQNQSDVSISTGIVVVKPAEIKNSYDNPIMTTPTADDPLWNLILLNPGNGITDEIPMEKVKFNSQYIDKRIGDSYQAMYAAAKEKGINLFLRSGHRTLELQRSYYEANIANYKKQGFSEAEAIAKTREYYTAPGHSEHHSGLAADIITEEYQRDITVLDDRFAKTEAYKWLIANCADYGFILRYPQNKTDITQINFESWHYRYVGIAHAKAIMATGVCLEEYIESMKLSFEKNSNGMSYEEFSDAFPEEFLKQWA